MSFAILIAAYNAESTLADTLESIRAQTRQPDQVIVCDDGSTDGTAELAARFAPSVTLVRQENRGEGGARNGALAAATASYVVPVDADDVLEHRCLEAYAAALTVRPDLDIVTCDAFLEANGIVFDRYYRRLARFVVSDQRLGALHQHFIFGAAAIRRQPLLAIGGWDDEHRRNADTELFVRLILEGSRAGLVYEPLVRYRLRPGTLGDDRAAAMRTMVGIVERSLDHPSLTVDERAVVLADLRQKEKLTRMAELEDALRHGTRDTRRYALRVARSDGLGYPARARLKALVCAGAPRLAGALLRARERRRGITSLRIRTRNF
ncbi:MAG TPA: glycosyltransferase family A protein [Gaiellaceae bacterium]|nr:glycosyltransferase family A protein [Gaiellaceae bacterium]